MVNYLAKPDYLFEISYEAVNKVGGIYTVLQSKAEKMSNYYKDNYCLIGPFNPQQAATEFRIRRPSQRTQRVFNSLADEGVNCHYGKWLVKGKPRSILIDFSKLMPEANNVKKWLWDDYKVDSWGSGHDFDEPVVWSWAAGRVLEALHNEYKSRMVAHFHEWLSGTGLLYLKSKNLGVGTVFTTHATVLGRTLAGYGMDVKNVDNPDRLASEKGVQAKHLLEKATANNADVFTTVSEITSVEAEKVLGRKPDLLLPNGLDMNEFPSVEEFSIKHLEYKKAIKDFLVPYFFPYYPVNLKDSLIFFMAGRNEFHAKGIDLFIQALGLLNKKMKKRKVKKDIFVFIWVPDRITGVPVSLLQSITLYQEIKNDVKEEVSRIGDRILNDMARMRLPKSKGLLDDDFLYEAKKDIQSFKKKGEAPLSAFVVPEGNNIIRALKENGLENSSTDKVRVIFYPIYLNPADGLLNLSYYDAIMGCHLGVFPSMYEPWGYTPLETSACGVPSVTTDLTGFGKFISAHSDDDEGIFVLKREGKDYEKSVKELADLLYQFTILPKKKRIDNKLKAKQLASMADWKKLIKNYFRAHEIALNSIGKPG